MLRLQLPVAVLIAHSAPLWSHTPLPTRGPEEHPWRIHRLVRRILLTERRPDSFVFVPHVDNELTHSVLVSVQHQIVISCVVVYRYTLMLLLQVEVNDTHEHLSE